MEVVFTPDECNYITSLWDSKSQVGLKDTRQKYRDDGTSFTLKISGKSSLNSVRITDKKELDFIKSKLKNIGVNDIHFGSVSIIRYDKGDSLAPHIDGSHPIDSDNSNISGQEFYKTLVLQLTDENEYEGGDFCLLGVPQSRKQGTYSLFLRTVEHEVREVKSGTRYSLVAYLTKKDLGEKQTLL